MAAGGKTALTILGYAACPSQTWDRLVEEVVREGGGSHTLEFFFAETPLKAVTSSIKLAARKLGLSLSATIPASAKKLRNMGCHASDPLEFSNFQVFKLATSLNVPSVLAAGEIRVEDGVYRVVCDVFEAGLVGTVKNSEDWSLEMTSLGWLRGCQLFQ